MESGSVVAIDASGNVYLAGFTDSPAGIASGGHDNTFAGGTGFFPWDVFLVKFNSTGVRQWSTYYGGAGDEGGSNEASVAVDATSGDVYLAGTTGSNTGIASGGFDNTFGGGSIYGDAFLVRFNSAGTRLWATYYGGMGEEVATSVTTDVSGNVYLAGYTQSSSGIASGGFDNTFGGVWDAFLVKFNSSGVRQWAT